MPAEALERLITMKTAECEGVETVGQLLADAVAGHGGKRRADRRQPQREGHRRRGPLRPEDRGLRRAELPRRHHAPSTFRSGIKVVSGVESDGMLASAAELGINRDHAGIIELRDGEDIPFPDSVIEIDNKSITHRPDLWGHHGMAREVAAITGKTLRDPVWLGSCRSAAGSRGRRTAR